MESAVILQPKLRTNGLWNQNNIKGNFMPISAKKINTRNTQKKPQQAQPPSTTD